jgi:hypothetical protein
MLLSGVDCEIVSDWLLLMIKQFRNSLQFPVPKGNLGFLTHHLQAKEKTLNMIQYITKALCYCHIFLWFYRCFIKEFNNANLLN